MAESKAKLDKSVCVSTWWFGLEPVRRAGEMLAAGRSALDAIEESIRIVEDDPRVRSVGYGGLPNSQGEMEMDAALMDGPRHRLGCVAALKWIRHPISVARLVMEKTPHIVLAGDGARELALAHGFQEENVLSEEARIRYEEWKVNPISPYAVEPFVPGHDTVCLLVRDEEGNLYGGASTSGLAWKMPGRVGDTPLPGAGLYVSNEIGAAAATGAGELAIEECASYAVVELMRNQYDPLEACQIVLERVVKRIVGSAGRTPAGRSSPKQLALIALRKDGKFGYAALMHGFQTAIFHHGKPFLVDVEPVIR